MWRHTLVLFGGKAKVYKLNWFHAVADVEIEQHYSFNINKTCCIQSVFSALEILPTHKLFMGTLKWMSTRAVSIWVLSVTTAQRPRAPSLPPSLPAPHHLHVCSFWKAWWTKAPTALSGWRHWSHSWIMSRRQALKTLWTPPPTELKFLGGKILHFL